MNCGDSPCRHGGWPLDPNRDGVSHPKEDEFVELVNAADVPLNLKGVTLVDAYYPRLPVHHFDEDQIVLGREGSLLVGEPERLETAVVLLAAHSGSGTDVGLNLRNDGNRVEVRGAKGQLLDSVGYGKWGTVDAPLDASLVQVGDEPCPHKDLTIQQTYSREASVGEWGGP